MLSAENQLGEEVQDPQNLETRVNTEKKSCNEDVRNQVPELTQDEVQAAIDDLKKKVKQVTTTGIQAEDIKTCDETTKEMIRQMFHEVLKQENCTPETWSRIRSTKKGNVEEVGKLPPDLHCASALHNFF